jgi:hypothetical protein
MHVRKLLHNWLDNACFSVDKRVRSTLFSATETLTRCKALSIFGLGRNLNRTAKVKHNIKCIDRLFGNVHLHSKKELFYQWMSRFLVKDNARPWVMVDWSGLTRCGRYHFLRASIPTQGRALTLYECAYPVSAYMSQKTHREFLTTLQTLLPPNCKPIVVTDAGFRNPWFRLVLSLEWDFIGRARHLTLYRFTGENGWKSLKNLYAKATTRATYAGKIDLAKINTLGCYAYLMRQQKRYRVKKNLAGKKIQCSVSLKHARRENEPWLLVSALSPSQYAACEVTQFYKKRMQIEEAFRDLKNTRNGFSLRQCRSYSVARLNIALLIAVLATFVLWLLGTAAKQKQWHRSFQANTEKRRNVLSNFTIGWQVLQRGLQLTKKELLSALKAVVLSANQEATTC